MTEQLLERERLQEERMKNNKAAKPTKTSGASSTKSDIKRKATKPTTEQETERQRLFSALNDVVLNRKKPGKEKDLRWDYEKDKNGPVTGRGGLS